MKKYLKELINVLALIAIVAIGVMLGIHGYMSLFVT